MTTKPETLDLFVDAYPATHRDALDTEHQAAAKVARKVAALHLAVFQELKSHPMTDRELENLPRFAQYGPSTIRKRRSELYHGGWLKQDGRRDGLTVWKTAR